MRRLLATLVIAVARAGSAGGGAPMTGPGVPVSEGTLIWDCGWRTL